MKKISIVLLLFVATTSFAQPSVNNYQYVIVPSKFSFSRSKDEFRLNSLIKFLLEKYGFKALLDSETQPDEIADSNCKKLYADVLSQRGLMTTRLRIILKDCKNKVLYTSDEGTSREKDIPKAYNLAIREAFTSFPELHYHYNPSGLANQNNQVKQTVVISQNFNDNEVLSAQPSGNGFQLVDRAQENIMQLFKTSSSDRFIAVKGDIHGELLLKNGQWYFEHYENNQLVSEHVNVKF